LAKRSWSPLKPDQVEDLIFYCAMGAVLGGRIGYVFFYGLDRFLQDPLWLFRVWEGGMAFHGGLLGVFFALWLYARRIKQPLGALVNFVAPLSPIGLGLGRLANFINGELYGRVTESRWGMIFPSDPLQLPRHASQLYQAFLEGVVLFVIVWWFAHKPRPNWSVAGLFLLVYGLARIVVEFFREPDAALAFEWVTRGQMLSIPMVVGGIIVLIWALLTQQAPPEQSVQQLAQPSTQKEAKARTKTKLQAQKTAKTNKSGGKKARR